LSAFNLVIVVWNAYGEHEALVGSRDIGDVHVFVKSTDDPASQQVLQF
jgi:hypothetical protein